MGRFRAIVCAIFGHTNVIRRARCRKRIVCWHECLFCGYRNPRIVQTFDTVCRTAIPSTLRSTGVPVRVATDTLLNPTRLPLEEAA